MALAEEIIMQFKAEIEYRYPAYYHVLVEKAGEHHYWWGHFQLRHYEFPRRPFSICCSGSYCRITPNPMGCQSIAKIVRCEPWLHKGEKYICQVGIIEYCQSTLEKHKNLTDADKEKMAAMMSKMAELCAVLRILPLPIGDKIRYFALPI